MIKIHQSFDLCTKGSRHESDICGFNFFRFFVFPFLLMIICFYMFVSKATGICDLNFQSKWTSISHNPREIQDSPLENHSTLFAAFKNSIGNNFCLKISASQSKLRSPRTPPLSSLLNQLLEL